MSAHGFFKGFRLLLAATLLVAGLTLPAFAADAGPKPLPKGNQVEQALGKFFPQVMPELLQIVPTPIDGMYEVQTRKGLIYFFPKQGYVIAGQLMNSEGRNLTRESIDRQMQEKLANLPLDEALKIGNGKNKVIEFTDPDCPFCRQGAKFWKDRKDVTRYIFLFPLKNHPNAEQKARFILSSKDPAKTYEEVMSGKYDKTPLPEFKDNGWLDKQVVQGQDMGIRSTPSYWVNGTFVSGANTERIKQLLGDSQPQPAAQAAKPEPKEAQKYSRPDEKSK